MDGGDMYNNGGYNANPNGAYEMNETAPINYNQQNYMTNTVRETSVESLNIDSMTAKTGMAVDVHAEAIAFPEESYILIWKYMEQIKSISAGLMLLLCGGLHTVWAIYQALFYETSEKYRTQLKSSRNDSDFVDRLIEHTMYSQRNVLMFTIIMWYVGVIFGCYTGGNYLVRMVQKRNIYYISALFMFISGCLFYGADVAESGWRTLLLCGRLFAGISHGLTFVTVLVQASDNAARNFRRIMVTIIGGTMAFSIFLASTFFIFIPVPDMQDDVKNTAEYSEVRSAGIISTMTFVFCFFSVPLNYLFSHETIPFLLYHNYREEEAQFTLAKLLGEENDSPLVQYEFNAIKEACASDYTEFPEGKIFRSIHRNLLSIALNGRIAAAQSFNIPIIVLIVKTLQAYYLRQLEKDLNADLIVTEDKGSLAVEIAMTPELNKLRDDLNNFNTVVKTMLFGWFIFGMLTTCLANYYHWRRGLHLTTVIAGATIITCVVLVFGNVMKNFISALTFLVMTIYFQFLTIPIDILGLNYLLECFPTSTKAMSIGFVTILECVFNIILVTIDLRYYELRFEFIPFGIILCVVGLKLYRNVPETFGFSLIEAKHAYLQATSGKKWWQF